MAKTEQRIGAILGQVLDVSFVEHRIAGYKYGEFNPAGHLLLAGLSGKARLDLNGLDFVLTAGTTAWLMEADWLRFAVLTAPWSYLLVRFSSSGLPILPPAERVKDLGSKVLQISRELRMAWQSEKASASRALLVHGLVEQMIGRMLADSTAMVSTPSATASLWWRVETEVRKHLGRTYTLADLCALAGTNRVVLEAAAKEATHSPPIRRLRQIRLLHAQTLMRNSNLLLKEIAMASGYSRLHEFSRDYRKQFGLSPHKHRSRGYPEAG